MLKAATVAADGRPTTFAGVPAGGWFGEGALLKGELRPYSVVAIRHSTVAFIPGSTFLWLLEESRPFSRWIIDQLNARLGYYVAMTENLRVQEPTARVAYCLSELFNPQLYPSTTLQLDISQEEVGRLSGVSRQHANRALHELQQLQLVCVGYAHIRVLDLDGLRRLSHRGNVP